MREAVWMLVFVVALAAVGGIVGYVGHTQEQAQKAELKAKIEAEGRAAALQGVPAEACPYMPGDDGAYEVKREHWMRGWQEGYLERQEHQEVKP